MKKLLFPLLTLLLLLSIAGCSTNSPSNKSTRPKDEDPEFGVSTQQLIEDISKNETIADCLSSKFIEDTPVEYVSHEITKRKTDEDDNTDTIYCSINIKEEYISAEIQAKMSYSFYDIGGWVLDNVLIEDYVLTPLKAANADMIISEAQGILEKAEDPFPFDDSYPRRHPDTTWICRIKYHYSEDAVCTQPYGNDLSIYTYNFRIINNEFLPECNDTRLHISLTSSATDLNGYFPLSFDSQKGWDWKTKNLGVTQKYFWPAIILTDTNTDNLQTLCGFYTVETEILALKITEINEHTHTISYVLYDYYSSIYGNTLTYNETVDFDPISTCFMIKPCSSISFAYMQFDYANKTWKEVNDVKHPYTFK